MDKYILNTSYLVWIKIFKKKIVLGKTISLRVHYTASRIMTVIRPWPRHVHGTRLNRSILINRMFSPPNSFVAVHAYADRPHNTNAVFGWKTKVWWKFCVPSCFRITEDRRPSTNLILFWPSHVENNQLSTVFYRNDTIECTYTHLDKRSINAMKCRNKNRLTRLDSRT